MCALFPQDTWEPLKNVDGNAILERYLQKQKGDSSAAMEQDGVDGFGPAGDDEDEDEEAGAEDTEMNEDEEEGDEEMNSEDQDFIVPDDYEEEDDAEEEEDADETDDDEEDGPRNAEQKGAGAAENAEGDEDAGWEEADDMDVQDAAPAATPPISAVKSPAEGAPGGAAAPSAPASASASPPGAAAAGAEESGSGDDDDIDFSKLAAKAEAGAAAREAAAAEQAAAAIASKQAAEQAPAAGPAKYSLRQINGPPLSDPIIPLPGPTTGDHREVEIGRATMQPAATTSFRLRLTKGEIKQSDGTPLQVIECEMREGWTFRLGRKIPAGYTEPAATSAHPMISGCHATLFYEKDTDTIKIRDSSTNGVFVNGAIVGKAAPPRRLMDGEFISLAGPDTKQKWTQLPDVDSGPIVFAFESVRPTAAAPTQVAAAAPTQVAQAGQALKRINLVDPKRQVSRKHATLRYEPDSDTFTIQDHGSTGLMGHGGNGVFANRLKVQRGARTPITAGTELVIGG